MVLEVRINNYRAYPNEVRFSMCVDSRIDGLRSNVCEEGVFSVLKSACVYGMNNSGKSCLIGAIDSIRRVLLNVRASFSTNIFTESDVCSLGISFTEEGKAYSYDFRYDTSSPSGVRRGFVYERFAELTTDGDGKVSERTIFMRDVDEGLYVFDGDERLNSVLDMFSSSNILINLVNVKTYPSMAEYRRILKDFASGIDVVFMDRITMNMTLDAMKSDGPMKDKIVEIIRKADLEIEDYRYLNARDYRNADVASNGPDAAPVLLGSAETSSTEGVMHLVSVHGGKPVQSISFDSDGTHRIISLASHIADTLERGGILILDELDNGLNVMLMKDIVSMFNDESNSAAQLIFTAHDASILGDDTVFRKDQIWFVRKEGEGRTLTLMSDEDGTERKIRVDKK